VFRSSKSDIKHVVGQPPRDPYNKPFMSQRPGPYDRPNFGGGPRRGRGGMGMGPSGFGGNSYDNGRMPRGGRGGPMRGGRGGGMGRIGGGGGGSVHQASKTGHCVHMRGLPFDSTTNDVIQFFAPLNPVDIRFVYDQNSGRAKGECDVDFSTHNDAEAAMQKDKQNIGHRYIELFLQSNPVGNMGGGGGGGGANGGWSNNSNDMNDMGRTEISPLMGVNNGSRPVVNQQSSGQTYGNSNSFSASTYGGGYGTQQQPSTGGYTTANPAAQTMGAGYGSYSAPVNQQTGGYDNTYRGANANTGVGGAPVYPSLQQGGDSGNNYYGNMR